MKISLFTKVALILFALIFAGGGSTAYLVYRNSTGALQNSISNNQTNEAKQTMDKIDRFLDERLIDMQSIAGRQQIQDFLSLQPSQRTPAAAALMVKQLDDFKIASGTWGDLTILDAQGNLTLPTDQQILANLLAKQPPVLKLYAGAAAGQLGYSDALPVLNGRPPVMLFMAPIRNQLVGGQPVVGVLVGELAWQANLDILRSLRGTTAILINDKGLSLGDNQPDSETEVLFEDFSNTPVFKAAQKTVSGAGVFPGLDAPKKTFLTSYVKEVGSLDYHGNGWILVLETPRSVAFAPANQLAKTLLLPFIVVLILSVFALLAVLRILVLKPILNLREVTGRLSGGDFSLRTTIVSKDELGDLGRDFNDMADKIQLARKNLTASIEETQTGKNILESLLERLPVGVLVVNASSGKPIAMNKIAEEISGHTVQSLANSPTFFEVFDFVKADGTPYPLEERPLTQAIHTGKVSFKEDMYIRRPDGIMVPVRTIAAPINQPGQQAGLAVSVFEDISKERELEKSRDEFFSIASHELRTPLTAIRGNTALIQQYYSDQLKDDQDLREMIGDIHESSIRLINIVSDFLDTSRLEQKRMKYEPEAFDIVSLVQSTIREYQIANSHRKIALEAKEPDTPLPKVFADKNRTRQVVINLVGNSLKFTSEGSINLSFARQDDFVKVFVSDTGQGISHDAQKMLFRKFEQTGDTVLTRDSVHGTGLGLYISKLIIEQMHGVIKLESSQPGVSTVFSFTLPVAKDSDEIANKGSGEPTPLAAPDLPESI